MSCLFCRIVAGDIPAKKVFEDDDVVAFEDINPQAPMHVLVVPRLHVATLNDLGDDHDRLVGVMVRRAAAIAAERGHAERGFRTVFKLQRRRRADRVPPAPARARRTVTCLAARMNHGVRPHSRPSQTSAPAATGTVAVRGVQRAQRAVQEARQADAHDQSQ